MKTDSFDTLKTTSRLPIRWLHLSDLHMTARERWDRRATLTALLRYAAKLRESDLAPNMVLITGDIASTGKHKEYEQAELFLSKLADSLRLDPRNHFFLVPGNHDVDRSVIGAADRRILRGLDRQEEIEEILSDPPTMGLLARRLDSFYAFTERFLGPARGWRTDRPWRVDVSNVAGFPVGILQLNSAWAAGYDDDQGQLLVGELQVRQALEEASDTVVQVALLHHPLDHLTENDRTRLASLLSSPGGVDFLLHGHLHHNSTVVASSPDGRTVGLAAGATYVGGRLPRTFLLTEVDITGGRVHFFRYSNEGRGFWTIDPGAYEGAPEGVWLFRLKECQQALINEEETEIRTKARRATISARYRAAAAAVHGSVRFIGFADTRPRRNVGVPELFVPLRMTEYGGTQDQHQTTSELLSALLRYKDDGATTRAVVLGNPGSGKTTLCKFATVVLAGEHELPGVHPSRNALPLLLPFREYVRCCREGGDRSILSFIEEQARHHLQVNVPERFFEKTLEKGDAVLLLDGLDEVGTASERVQMCERVQAFCRLYPRTAAIITSRVAGYEQAPLPQTGPGSFRHLELVRFDDEDLRLFVRHWYTVQEPDDPLARDRGIVDLTAAINASRSVREMARNPMLATLIALVHRYEAHLPGERAVLYDLCVKTILETWPVSHRRRFREIDERLQRAYLEILAYRLHTSRTMNNRNVVISQNELIDTLVKIICEQEGDLSVIEKTQRLVESWVRYLQEGTGLLVEQQPGTFTFFHQSLMEYLAARGMDRAEDLVEAIGNRWHDPHSKEVCLLAAGSRATDKVFLDRLYQHLEKQIQRDNRWSFLLNVLSEEAAFSSEQRTTIIRQAGKALIGKGMHAWTNEQRAFESILDFSVRHSNWAQEWTQNELTSAIGQELLAIIALCLPRKEEIIRIIQKRPDASIIAKHLIDFGVIFPIGRWAASTIGSKQALDWVQRSGANELFVIRALEALWLPDCRLSAPLVPALARLAEFFRARTGRNIRALEKIVRPGGIGLPDSIMVEPGGATIFVRPRLSHSYNFEHELDRSRRRRYFARNFARDFTIYFSRYFGRLFSKDFARNISKDFARGYASYFAMDYTKDFSAYRPTNIIDCFSIDTIRDYSMKFANNFLKGFASYFLIHSERESADHVAIDFERLFNLSFLTDTSTQDDEQCILPPNTEYCAGELLLRDEAMNGGWLEIKLWLMASLARLAGEAWAALAMTTNEGRKARTEFVHRRTQNAWLLHVWPAVDRLLPENPSPETIALYLALGWTQATTTSQWPSTRKWKTLLGSEAPNHWLTRSQWHMCWILHEPDSSDHLLALDQALCDGLSDVAHPGVAEVLRELYFPSD